MDNLFLLLFLLSLAALVIGIIKPSAFSRFLKGNVTRKKIAKIFGSATVISYILFAAIPGTTPTENQTATKQLKQATKQPRPIKSEPSKGTPVKYEIVDTRNQSHKALGKKPLSEYTLQEVSMLPVDKKMAYSIIVSPGIKENQVKPTIEKIVSDITLKDNDIDEIFLSLYSNKELVGGAYDVARAIWAPGGQLGNITPKIAKSNIRASYKISIRVKENLEEYLKQRGKSEEKFGFSEEQRRQIFKEIVAVEDKSQVEANKIYPTYGPNYKKGNIPKNIDKTRELAEKYKARVFAKYGITEEIMTKISCEGLEESWPCPDLPSGY